MLLKYVPILFILVSANYSVFPVPSLIQVINTTATPVLVALSPSRPRHYQRLETGDIFTCSKSPAMQRVSIYCYDTSDAARLGPKGRVGMVCKEGEYHIVSHAPWELLNGGSDLGVQKVNN